MSDKIGLGSEVFFFDENRRIYERDSSGRTLGGALYREHFRKATITGETSKSWLVGDFRPTKYAKNGGKLYTAQQVDDLCWKRYHSIRIVDYVKNASVEDLKKIADIVGYKQKTTPIKE